MDREFPVIGRLADSAEGRLHMGRTGSGIGFDSHRIEHAGGSSEWRSYAKAAAMIAPWLVLAAIFVGAFVSHGVVDRTPYRPTQQAAIEASR